MTAQDLSKAILCPPPTSPNSSDVRREVVNAELCIMSKLQHEAKLQIPY